MLYAEIHSPLPPIPNLLNNKLPEIIADAPRRINRNRKLPILVLVKDSHLYPLDLISITAEITQAGVKIQSLDLWKGVLPLAQKFWSHLFVVDPGTQGRIEIEVIFTLQRKGRLFVIRNHSYAPIPKKALDIYVSSDDLPDGGRIQYGDLHCHSAYTDDPVEFGAPIAAIARMAAATGLSFIAVTDHSYDLDDGLTPPSKHDPDLRKWKSFLDECSALETEGMTVVPGIEVSAGSAKGKNVHLLILNPQGFHRGRGDSGDTWFKTRPDDSVAEILARLDPRELAIAAHPFHKIRFLEKRLLRRGDWDLEDVGRAGLAGLQIFNGLIDADFKASLKRWTEILLRGQKKFIYAGNDAHGSFNRSIQIKTPHLRLQESRGQIFGFMKTGIYANETLDEAGLLSHLRRGRCFATTGPSIFFHLQDARGRYFPGDEAAGRRFALSLEMKSIPEFGKITSAAVILGDLVARTEKECPFKVHDLEFSFQGGLPFGEWPRRGYIRIAGEAERGIAISNPVWVTN